MAAAATLHLQVSLEHLFCLLEVDVDGLDLTNGNGEESPFDMSSPDVQTPDWTADSLSSHDMAISRFSMI